MRKATACAAKMGWNVLSRKPELLSAADDARRAVRRGWNAAGDFMDDVTYAVKKEPLKSVGITFGVAFGIGALAGWLGGRK